MSSCANCNKTFKKKPGDTGFYRFSLENALPSTGINARVQLEKMTGQPLTPVAKKLHGRFLCPQCWSKVNTSSKYEQASKEFFSETLDESYIASKRPSAETVSSPGTSFKRPRFTSTPLKHKPKTARSIFGRSGPPPSKWDTIITAIRARQYRRAIKGLYKASPATKRHFIAVATMIVRKEVKTILKERKTFPLAKEVNIPSIQDFSWEKTLAMAEQSTPLLLGVLKGAVTKKSNEKSMVRGSRVQLKPKLGTAMALLLHARSPQICKFLPTLFSVQFWRGRLKRETMDQMSRLGICVSPNAALSAIDKIRSDFDAAALLLKEKMEKVLLSNLSVNVQENHELSVALCQSVANIEDEITVLPDKEFDDTILYSEAEDTTLSSKYPYDELEIDIDVNDDDDDDDDDEKCGSEEDDDDDDDDKDDDDEDEATHYDVIDAGEGGVEQRYGTDDVNLPVSEEMGENSEVMIEESMEFEVSGMDEPAPTHPFGYTMCWDNVGKKVVTRRPNENVKNKYINMALGYLAVNRVPNPHISIDSNNVLKASNIPVLSFIPGNEEFSKLKNRMQVLVGRILVRHIPWFRDNFSQFSIPHIVHDHTIESTYKTLLVNLGVFNEEPSSTQGAIGIYTKLQNYVPVVNGTPCPVVVYGDGLSCERGNDAQCARTNGLDPMERLEGLEPAAQEFHKEMLLLQDFFDDFFKGSSASERGTVSQVKNMFNYRQVKADISDNFSHAWELMCLLTEAYTCLLVMDNEGIPPDGSQPAAAPDDLLDGTDDVKYAYFEKACQDIVNNAWHKLDTDLLKLDDGSGPAVFCCGEDIDEELIGCECRSNCPKGEFFHYTCAGVDPANIVAPWYCSEDCRNRVSSGYQYCTCKQDLGTNEPMIGCSAEGMCTNAEWYHMRCLGIDPKKKQKREWYCSDECKKQRKKKTSTARKDFTVSHDSKRSYSLALLWRGLNLLCRRDAVREADGETMMAFWKIDLVHFFGNRHPKYTILAHRLIASINGWASQRIKHDLIHNRTVNYGGGIGRNLPLDFMNEILNRLFKDLLESAKGRYTDTTVNRCSQIVGPLGESLDMVFDTNVVENEIYRHRRRAVSRDGNVSRLIEFLYEENLFRSVPGRKHVAFQNFAYSETPKLAGKFVSKMKQLSKKLDRRRAAILDS